MEKEARCERGGMNGGQGDGGGRLDAYNELTNTIYDKSIVHKTAQTVSQIPSNICPQSIETRSSQASLTQSCPCCRLVELLSSQHGTLAQAFKIF